MFKEFKEFAIKGNMVDLAIGVVMGGAFGSIVNSLVKDVIMPPVGALLGAKDFANLFWVVKQPADAAAGTTYATIAAAAEAGATTLNYGVFINTILNFLIIAFAMFVVVKAMNKLRRAKEEEATTKECQYCKTEIAVEATRCPACTSELVA